jgi:hypothetical protein
MNKQQRPWRLPEGVKFYVLPRYILIVSGVEVKLTERQSEIVLFLMAHPMQNFSAAAIMNAINWHREDGGPEDLSCISVYVCSIKKRCKEAGIVLRLKMPGAHHGYAFTGIGLTRKGQAEADRLAAIPPDDPKSLVHPVSFAKPKPKAAKKIRTPKAAKAPKKKRPMYPYIDTYEGTGGWTFPLRVERYQHDRQDRQWKLKVDKK